jgi:predicted MPP superfamily phosphohydrolase
LKKLRKSNFSEFFYLYTSDVSAIIYPMNKKLDKLWDLFCIASIVGIWPRYIEPRLLHTTRKQLSIANLPKSLEGLRILQFSDLHLHSKVSNRSLEKLSKKIMDAKPDIIVFTGDFICYSTLSEKERLIKFLKSINAPHGCFCIYGNHDYEESISINDDGNYDTFDSSTPNISRAFQRLFSIPPKKRIITDRAKSVGLHQELSKLIADSHFKLLDNETKIIPIGESKLNICGLGEYMLGRCLPEIAFNDYDKNYPGIILAHNPDSISKLADYPGNIILCGHTHGAQVNIPILWKRFVLIENLKFKRGLVFENDRWVYVNRGVGSTLPFRLFSIPEILLLTLKSKT